MPLSAGKSVTGVVDTVQNDGGVIRLSGRLNGTSGDTFGMNIGQGQVSGLIQLPSQKSAFRVENGATATPKLQKLPLDSVICYNYPGLARGTRASAGAPSAGAPSAGAQAAVPILNSRPSAAAQIYLDFDGETVDDPDWNSYNGGKPIVMEPSGYSEADVAKTFNLVKEDYAPFDINVTTDVAKYNAAPVGKRARCIIGVGPTSFDPANSAGGVSYVGAFAGSGKGFSSTVPSFVFVNNVGDASGAAVAASHELGHTMGLEHDGTVAHDGKDREEYYAGHDCDTGGWAPIMGVAYGRAVVQWSKGEYLYADNQEDDLAIISGQANSFGYARDEAGSTLSTAVPLKVSGNNIKQSGIIQQTGDSDIYSFSAEGNVTISLAGTAPSPDLDAQLEILDYSGRVLQTSNPANQMSASLSRNLSPGYYYVRVSGVGLNTPSNGYSNYASIGAYTLTGIDPPFLPSFTLTGTVTLSDSSTSTVVPLAGANVFLDNGLRTTTNASGSYTIAGVRAGTYSVNGSMSGYSFTSGSVTFVGTNGGTTSVNLTATKTPARYTINGIVRNVQGRNTSGIAVLLNGQNVPVATSGAGGAFTIANMPPGNYSLSANVQSQLGVAKVTLDASGTLSLTKGPDGRTSGRIENNKVILQPIRSSSVASAIFNPSAPKS